MESKEPQIKVSDLRLLRLIPSGIHSVKEIVAIYNRRYPPASRPRQVINWLTRASMTRYRLAKLEKAELINRDVILNGKKKLIHFKVTPKGDQYLHDH